MEYTIKTPAENPKEATIEKKGVLVHFSMAELEAQDVALAKVKKECEGQIELESAKMTNIETHHDFVTKMTEEELFTAHMYQESRTMKKSAEARLAAVTKQLEEDAVETEEILKQLPELAKAPKVEAADQSK